MRTIAPFSWRLLRHAFRLNILLCGALLALASIRPPLQAAETGRTFAKPEDAVAALAIALKGQDSGALWTIFGPGVDDMVNPDRVQATNEFRAFAEAVEAGYRLVSESSDRQVLELGADHWPFPIPLVRQAGGWVFDTAAGKEELLNRRIGQNELATLEVVRAYVQAQREYASRDRDGDEVLEYARNLRSSPGLQDGLYWQPEEGGEMSPLGPLVADAQTKGYRLDKRNPGAAPEAFCGYYFRILERQGRHAPGGKYNYVINGNMIAGFALLAWPAEWGHSGIMTFVVNQQGRVWQKDLGPKTSRLADSIKAFDPDSSWRVSPN